MTRLWPAIALVGLLLAACGEDSGTGAEPAPANAAECGDVTVPGHEAVGISASGVDCAQAEAVAAAAEGRGRARYEAEGFSCEPAGAGGGDTNYTCTRDEAEIRFRYGTA